MKSILSAVAILIITINGSALANEKQIKPKELANHATVKSCWMAIDGKVYDMTPYLKLHDQECKDMQLSDYCGKDATEIWKKAEGKHRRKSRLQMERIRVGSLTEP